MKITISGGRVIDPVSQRDEVVDVFIDGDTIIGLGRTPAGFKPARVIEAKGAVVCPGFTEVGARLREPGAEHKATIASELEAAAANGFTTVCCMPDTNPVIDTPAVVELVNQRARGVRGARVRCIGALTQDLGGSVLAEMAALKEIGCVGVANAGHALRDCLRSINAPALEIHITNIEKRGYGSITSEAAIGMIAGFGVDSYVLALDAMVSRLRREKQVTTRPS